MNAKIRAVVAEELTFLAAHGKEPDDGTGFGPTVVATVAALFHSAGYLTESFAPHVNGDVVAKTAEAQFNEGRADFRLFNRETVQ
jgi:hypothetical protein